MAKSEQVSHQSAESTVKRILCSFCTPLHSSLFLHSVKLISASKQLLIDFAKHGNLHIFSFIFLYRKEIQASILGWKRAAPGCLKIHFGKSEFYPGVCESPPAPSLPLSTAQLFALVTVMRSAACSVTVVCYTHHQHVCGAGIADKLKCLRVAIRAPPINFIIQLT
jgi:hypothetical protein